jgi:DNA polymerase
MPRASLSDGTGAPLRRVPRPVQPAAPQATLERDHIHSLDELKAATMACRECPIGQFATQSVIGEGHAHARLMLVGEQPGDQEDLQGRPFVGPAGNVLDRALARAGIDRGAAYLTNAVKHFKFEPRGKRRIHKKPNTTEVNAPCPVPQVRAAASTTPRPHPTPPSLA